MYKILKKNIIQMFLFEINGFVKKRSKSCCCLNKINSENYSGKKVTNLKSNNFA
jgi:hypothetical protein